jgi:hypothetical protein
MTLDQCNQAMGGRAGRITGASGSTTFYEWDEPIMPNSKLAPPNWTGPTVGVLPYTGTIENGKLVGFNKGIPYF